MKRFQIWAQVLLIILPLWTHSYTSLNWTAYKSQYSKTYQAADDATRQSLYTATLDELTALQTQIAANSLGYTVDINQYSDWTDEELRVLMNGVKQKSNPRGDSFSDYQTGKIWGRRLAASSINWKSQITAVRSQGSECASAWAFAVVAMCEAAVILKETERYNFAEQYLLECSSYSNCDGGYLQYGLERVINKAGLPQESSYAYNPTNSYSGICSTGDLTFVSLFYYSFYGLSDSQMKQLLQNGPVAVSVSSEGWEHYSSGIYECSENPNIDHAALLVGYTSSYWYLKNSWGTGWGESGYIKITRTRSKNCGIGTSVFALGQLQAKYSILLLFLVAVWAIVLF